MKSSVVTIKQEYHFLYSKMTANNNFYLLIFVKYTLQESTKLLFYLTKTKEHFVFFTELEMSIYSYLILVFWIRIRPL